MVFLACCILLSLLAYFRPDLAAWLIYERRALLQGELWRFATGSFVHFSASHLSWDLLVLTVAGLALRARGYRGLEVVCAIAAFSSGIFLLVALPEISHFGGLSGLATGAVVYLCLCEIARGNGQVRLWWAVLLLCGVKTIAESVFHVPLFAEVKDVHYQVLPSVHLVGCLAAFAAFWAIRPDKRLEQTSLRSAAQS